jgi:DNA-directed RNA polymerase subunit beta'
MGRLIPAGTGLPAYKRLTVLADGEEVKIIDRPRPRPIPTEDTLIAVNEEE